MQAVGSQKIIIFMSLILGASACDTSIINPCYKDYTFSIPVELEPVTDTISVDDTLNLSFSYSLDMINTIDSSVVNLEDFPINWNAKCFWIHEDPTIDAEQEFEAVAYTGEIEWLHISVASAIMLRPELVNDRFVMNFGLVPKAKGMAYIIIRNFESIMGYPDIEEDCNAAEIKFHFPINNQLDNNYHLNEFSPDPNIQSMEKEFFDERGGFIFVVED